MLASKCYAVLTRLTKSVGYWPTYSFRVDEDAGNLGDLLTYLFSESSDFVEASLKLSETDDDPARDSVVGPLGFEPRTDGLKDFCS
jgi:hypothetical protein